MAETVRSLSISVKIVGKVIGDDGAELTVDESYEATLTEGTAANQIGTVWQDKTRALNTTTEDLDVAGGLTDFQGAALALNNAKLIYLRNLDDDAGDAFKLGGAASNAFSTMFDNASDKAIIGPGGILLMISPVDGYAVTAGTGDILRVEAVDNSTYRLILAGDNA